MLKGAEDILSPQLVAAIHGLLTIPFTSLRPVHTVSAELLGGAG